MQWDSVVWLFLYLATADWQETCLNGCNSALTSRVAYCWGVDLERAGVASLLSGLISSHAVDLIDFSSKITSVSSLATEENRCGFSVPGCEGGLHLAVETDHTELNIHFASNTRFLLATVAFRFCQSNWCWFAAILFVFGRRWEPQSRSGLAGYERYFFFHRGSKR